MSGRRISQNVNLTSFLHHSSLSRKPVRVLFAAEKYKVNVPLPVFPNYVAIYFDIRPRHSSGG
jgi:hypothetical protein